MNEIEQLFERMQAGDFAVTSEFGARDESIQSNARQRGFKKFKYEEKANKRVLMPKELALSVDPFTGRESDKFNKDNKFRPAVSWTTAVKLVKKIVSQNKDAIPNYLRRASLAEDTVWNVDDFAGPITDIDRKIFRGDTVVRTLTETVASIRSQNITGYDDPMAYRVSIYRDAFGKIVGTGFEEDGTPNGEVPLWAQMAQVFSSANLMQIKEVRELRKNADPDWKEKWKSENPDLKGLDIVEINDDNFNEKVVNVIRREGLISEEFPTNYIVAYIFDMDNETGLIKGANKFEGMTSKDLEENMFLIKRNKKINEAIELFNFGQSNASNDVFDDFFELQLQGPTQVPDGKAKNMLVAQKTTFSVPSLSIGQERDPNNERSRGYNPGFCDLLCTLVRTKQDETENIEFRFKGSTRTRELDAEVEELLIKEFVDMQLLTNRSKYLPDNVLKRHKDLFIRCYGPDAADFFDALDGGLEDPVIGDVSAEEINESRRAMEGLGDELQDTDPEDADKKDKAAADATADALEKAKAGSDTEELPLY